MLKDWQHHITKNIEWVSTWWDHFRHVYSFIECLHDSVINQKDSVNYDARKRFDISLDTYPQYVQKIGSMIFDIQQELSKVITVKSLVYTDFFALSSIKRELEILLEHDESHHSYFHEEWSEYFPESATYTIWDHIDFAWDNKNIILHIDESIHKYHSVSTDIDLPIHLQQTYNYIAEMYTTILNLPQGCTLIKTVNWDDTTTSRCRELYNIEESMMHFLYDIRIYLKKHYKSYYNTLIGADPQFGIAHSTRHHILSQSQ